MPFSPQMLDLLTENVLRNDKQWYRDNRDRFKELVETPLAEFAERVNSYIVKADPTIDKVHISRIYRDARFLGGKSFFRENMWVSFGRVKDLYKSLPAFYFDISPQGAEFGNGFYVADTATMVQLRSMITAGSPKFNKALAAFEKAKDFELYGDLYKKSRFPDSPEKLRNWLDRKTIGVFSRAEDWDLIFSADYADHVGKRLTAVKDVYDLFLSAALAAGAGSENEQV